MQAEEKNGDQILPIILTLKLILLTNMSALTFTYSTDINGCLELNTTALTTIDYFASIPIGFLANITGVPMKKFNGYFVAPKRDVCYKTNGTKFTDNRNIEADMYEFIEGPYLIAHVTPFIGTTSSTMTGLLVERTSDGNGWIVIGEYTNEQMIAKNWHKLFNDTKKEEISAVKTKIMLTEAAAYFRSIGV
jgi:hypothetical protein